MPEPTSSLPPPDLHEPAVKDSLARYWRSNVKWTVALLAVWAVVGLGCGILAADILNGVRLPGTGYPLGFWFAQQGSIIVFVALILVYCIVMNRLDARHRRELEQARAGDAEGGA
jgi:putative solute:sodium symporter small subunit